MRKKISRRTLLRGTGVAMALPWLESMAAAAPARGADSLAEPPLRMAFLYMENGVRPELWTPPGDGEKYEITPHLKALEPYRDDFLLLEISGIRWPRDEARTGRRSRMAEWIARGANLGDNLNSNGITVDQVMGQRIGDRTALPTLEIGIDTPRTGIDTAGGGFARMYGPAFRGGIRVRR